MEKRFLIVGAGLTGSLTAALLKRASLPIVATVWDKAKGAGGRMSTHRDPDSPDLRVDMGAQYVSRTRARAEGGDREYELLKESLYEELVSNGVLAPFCGRIEGERADLTASVVQNYASPKGLNGIVKHFLAQSGADVSFQRRVTGVCAGEGEGRCKVTYSEASPDGVEGKEEALFDGVVLTMPVPQLLQLGGNMLERTSEDIHKNLGSVKYSSRYALGLFFKEPLPTPLCGGWSAKYFDDPIVRYASWDTLKRGCISNASGGGSSSLLLHTGVPFGIQHLEDSKEEVKRLVIERAAELIPDLPPPAHDHIVRWRYSQVSQVYPGSPGAVVLSPSPGNDNPLIVATGDGFSGSNFENCIRAGQSAAKAVIEHMRN